MTIGKIRIAALAFAILVITLTNAASASGCGSIPSGLLYCIPITVQNSQTSAFASNTQIPISFAASNSQWNSYLSGNLANVEFYYANGTVIPSWLEGNVANENVGSGLSSNTVLYWLLINNAQNFLPASGSNTLYLGIAPTSTNFYSTSNTGAAPQLFCASGCPASTYAGVDNGAHVFPTFYQNFVGTSTPSGWKLQGSGVSQNNGATAGGSSGLGALYTNSLTYGLSSNTVLDFYGTISGSTINGDTTGAGFTQSDGFAGAGVASVGAGIWGVTTDNWHAISEVGSSQSEIDTSIPPSSAIVTTYWASGSSATITMNYASAFTLTSSISASSTGIGVGGNNAASQTLKVNWMRLRTNPPNRVNPTVTFGNGQALVAVTFGSNPITYGATTSVTATCAESSDTCAVQAPLGTNLCTGTGTCTYNLPQTPAAGTYTYYANDLTTNNNNAGILTVNQASAILSWTNQCASYIAVFGTPNPCTTTAQLPSVSNQLIGNLYLNSALVGSTSSSNDMVSNSLSTNNVGTYVYTFNTLGNGNYISNSISYTTEIYNPATICGTLPSALAISTQYCQSIPIQNTQSTALASNTQIMIPYNSLAYTSYLASNMMNIYIYNSISGATAPAWIEGNILNEGQTANLNTAANVIIWVKIPDAIAASSTDPNWYIAYGATNTNYYSQSAAQIGAAPQLFCASGCPTTTYAGVDNGASVFNFYDNFSGTSLNSAKWTGSGEVVDNGITIPEGSSITSSPYKLTVGILESLMSNENPGGGSSANCGASFGYGSGFFSTDYGGCGGFIPLGQSLAQCSGSSCASAAITTDQTQQIWGITYNGASSTLTKGYVVEASLSADEPTYPEAPYWQSQSSSGWKYIAQWVRTRTYPPNGVMPTVTFNSVLEDSTLVLSFGSNSIAYGSSTTVTATAGGLAANDNIAVQSPLGTNLCTGTGTCTYTTSNSASAGTYTYYANDLTTNNNVEGALTVNKASSLPSWINQCAAYIVQFGTPNPCTTTAQLPSVSNQLIGNLYLNNVLVGSTSSSNDMVSNALTTNNIGTYSFTFNTLGNGNYLANSISYTVDIYTTTACGNLPSSLSGSTIRCQQLSIQNTQSSAMTANTQVMIPYNSLAFSSYLASNMMNIYVYNSISGATAPAWIEGNILNEGQTANLNTAANVIIWVKIPDAIAASSTDPNWYIAYGATNTNYYSQSAAQIGAAPQLFCASGCPSGAYAGVDNGANVFNFYQNFAGTATPSGWTLGAGWSVNNALITAAGTGAAVDYVYYSVSSTPTTIEDFYANLPTASTTDQFFGFATSTPTRVGWLSYTGFLGGGAWFLGAYNGAWAYSTANSYSGPGVYTTDYVSTSNLYGQFNYGAEVDKATTDIPSSIPMGGFQYSGSGFNVQWIRTRTYPPNGVMPAVAIKNTVGFFNVSIYPSSSSEIPGSQFTISATATYGTSPYTYQWYNVTSGTAVAISGATSSKYTATAGSNTLATYTYYVKATDSESPAQTVQSSNSIITISSPTSIFLPITLYNTQNTATPNPFQQMINISETPYSPYLTYNSNFANFEFFYANSTIIPSWVESNSSGKLVAWVKTIGIPASSNIIIYMGFAPKSTNLLSSSGTNGIGEAPQLPSTYANFDDGASVFNFYDNFAGTSLNSTKWTGSGETVSNGITIPEGSTVTSASYTLGIGTLESLMVNENLGNGGSNSCSALFGYGPYLASTDQSGCGGTIPLGQSLWQCNGSCVGTSITVDQTQQIWGLTYTGSTSVLTKDYSTQISLSSDEPTYPQHLSWQDSASSGWKFIAQWIRTRAYPPSGVMPSATFGNVHGPLAVSISAFPALPATLAPGQTETFNAIANGGSGTYTTYNFLVFNSISGIQVGNYLSSSNSFAYLIPSSQLGNTLVANVIVTDSGGNVTNSIDTGILTVALPTASLSTSPSTLDTGQTETLTATWSQGTSPFTVNFFNVTGSTTQNVLITSSSPATNSFIAGAVGSFTYNVIITDSSTPAETTNSIQKTIVVSPLPTVTATNPTQSEDFASGQSVTFTTTNTIGSGGDTYQWYNTTSGSPIAITGQTSTSLSVPGNAIGTFTYNVLITDSNGGVGSSNTVTLKVNPALAVNALTPAAPTINSGQAILLTSQWTGGTSTYTIKWLTGPSTNTCAQDSANVLATYSSLSTLSNSIYVSPTTTNGYCTSVSDSSAGGIVTSNSPIDVVTVTTTVCTISLSANQINFGLLNPFASTSTVNSITDTNSGNVNAYLLAYGSNWISGSNSFYVSNTVWSPLSGTSYSSSNKLSASATNTLLVIPASGSNTIYFGLGIPGDQAVGTYQQTITLENSC